MTFPSLPTKNVSLAKRLNSRKENGNDKDSKSALDTRIQARGSAIGRRWPEDCGRGTHAGSGRPDAVQSGQGQRHGQLKGADSKPMVSAEQMESSLLRAELACVNMDRYILGKATAYFAKGST